MTTDILTPTEVAELLAVSPVTVRQWAQKGLHRSAHDAGRTSTVHPSRR